jgi:hypothetical protein
MQLHSLPQVSKIYNDPGQTYNIYDETTGVNPTATNAAISYIIGALQAGIPVVVGVDCRPGTSLGSNDNTTDHFVTIVGMGYSSMIVPLTV